MKHKEQLRIIIATYIVGVSLNLLFENIIGNFPHMEALISSLKVSSFITIWWLFYFYYGWKIPIFNKILFRINLNGTWFGEYDSINNEKERFKGDIALRIKQNYLSISIKSFTEKYDNFSYSEEVKYEEKSGTHGVIYVYSQKENNILDTARRNGTSELTLKKEGNDLLLEGMFWTIHGTQGSIKVKKISSEQIDTFNEAIKIATKNRGK